MADGLLVTLMSLCWFPSNAPGKPRVELGLRSSTNPQGFINRGSPISWLGWSLSGPGSSGSHHLSLSSLPTPPPFTPGPVLMVLSPQGHHIKIHDQPLISPLGGMGGSMLWAKLLHLRKTKMGSPLQRKHFYDRGLLTNTTLLLLVHFKIKTSISKHNIF